MRTRCRAGLALACLAAVLLGGCALMTRKSYEDHESAAASGLTKVRVEADNGSIEVRAEEGDAVEVHFVKNYRATNQGRGEVYVAGLGRVERRGDVLHVDARTGSPPRGVTGVSVSVTLRLPPGVDLELVTSNGSVDVRGTRAALAARTSNGAVNVADVKGDIALMAANGSITVRDADGTLSAATSNGRIVLDHVSGEECVVGAANGSIDALVSPRGACRFDFSVSNGGVTLSLPWDVSAVLDVSVPVGGITSDFPLRMDGDRGSATLGGGGGTISVSSRTGRIVLESRR